MLLLQRREAQCMSLKDKLNKKLKENLAENEDEYIYDEDEIERRQRKLDFEKGDLKAILIASFITLIPLAIAIAVIILGILWIVFTQAEYKTRQPPAQPCGCFPLYVHPKSFCGQIAYMVGHELQCGF